MRTTLAIDDDIMLAVRERAAREHRTAGQVLSDLAREALTGADVAPPTSGDEFLGFRPLPHRGVTISNSFLEQLREEEDI